MDQIDQRITTFYLFKNDQNINHALKLITVV